VIEFENPDGILIIQPGVAPLLGLRWVIGYPFINSERVESTTG
jgi:hypothetical protein